MQSAPYAPVRMVVRPQITDSTVRLLDEQVESFGRDPKPEPGVRALSAMFAGLAASVRAGESIYFELDFEPCGAPMHREITSAIEHTISMHVSEDGNRVEAGGMWSYFSDLAALAADIEAVFAPSPTTATVEPIR